MLPDTLLGPEATGPAAPTPVRGGKCRPPGWGVVVVAPSWWWGVVFDLWIVVASIRSRAFSSVGLRVSRGMCVWFVVV